MGEQQTDQYTITLGELALAIKNTVHEHEMPDEVAEELAYRVLNFFGHSDRVVDNVLEPVDRDAFYMLEDSGILTTEMEEVTLYDGKEWRIHYWLFRREHIRELIEGKASPAAGAGSDSVYDSLTDEVWHRDRRS